MNRTTVGIIIAALIVLFIAFVTLGGRSTTVFNSAGIAEPEDDPIDVTLELMGGWHTQLQATSTVPLADFLETQPAVTTAARSMMLSRAAAGTDLDPVLCQTTVPLRIGAKQVYVTKQAAQMMVVARGEDKNPNSAVVNLHAEDGSWMISDVQCSAEAGATVGEYTFVQTGRLARETVPAPYDSSVWHIIFTDETGRVSAVPLLITTDSQCVTAAGVIACDDAQFVEGAIVMVQADMAEAGAVVQQLELE